MMHLLLNRETAIPRVIASRSLATKRFSDKRVGHILVGIALRGPSRAALVTAVFSSLGVGLVRHGVDIVVDVDSCVLADGRARVNDYLNEGR
jgi:hypothetical protein